MKNIIMIMMKGNDQKSKLPQPQTNGSDNSPSLPKKDEKVKMSEVVIHNHAFHFPYISL